MLCPASKDPFSGENYRIWGTLHQLVLCPLACKIFVGIAAAFLTRFNLTRVKQRLEDELVILPVEEYQPVENDTSENRLKSE